MNLIKWNPFSELEDISSRLNQIFGRSAASATAGHEMMKVADWAPSVDISETDQAFLIKAEMPGVKKEDVKVTVDNGVLTIQGERKMEKEEKGKTFHRIERSYGSFVRSFRVPAGVDDSKAKAEFKDGMINVTLPKSEKAKSKSVEIAVS